MGDGEARVLPGGTDPAAVAEVVDALRATLSGTGPVLALRDSHAQVTPPPTAPLPPDTGVVLRTSGSTGLPRAVALGVEALLASARACHGRLGGPGRWLLALPIHHVAGFQVLVRSVLASGEAPAVVDLTRGFSPADVAPAVASMPADTPRYTSLVPTQLARVIGDPAAVDALRSFDAILVGGAATPPDLRRRAGAAGLRVVTTYGMTETGGGCVYDGVPLDGVRVAALGRRLEIAGPVVALGYAEEGPERAPSGDPADEGAAFVVRDGERWFRTADLGTVGPDGRVHVDGRADDAVVTGGLKVHPGPVERVIGAHPGIADVVVVGVPDDDWGQVVTAVVVPADGHAVPALREIRGLVAGRLGRAHAPRRVVVLDRLPLRGPGKVDRTRVATLAADILTAPGAGAGPGAAVDPH